MRERGKPTGILSSSFGTSSGEAVREPVFPKDEPLEQARLAIAAYFRCPNVPAGAHLSSPLHWAWKIQAVNQNEATALFSTGIGEDRQGQGEEEKAAQIDCCADGM